jgi:hypothetical protein
MMNWMLMMLTTLGLQFCSFVSITFRMYITLLAYMIL